MFIFLFVASLIYQIFNFKKNKPNLIVIGQIRGIVPSVCKYFAWKNNIPFIWNSKFPINSLYLMRGYLYVDDNHKNDYLNAFFDA